MRPSHCFRALRSGVTGSGGDGKVASAWTSRADSNCGDKIYSINWCKEVSWRHNIYRLAYKFLAE